jgi:hypothetical protein
MTGYERDEVIGQNCRFLQGEGTDRDTIARISEVVKSGGELTVKVRARPPRLGPTGCAPPWSAAHR